MTTTEANSPAIKLVDIAAAPSEKPQKSQNSQESKVEQLVGEYDFLNGDKGPNKGVQRLVNAYVLGHTQNMKRKEEETKLSKIAKILFPNSSNKNLFKDIQGILDATIVSFAYRDTLGVKEGAKKLCQMRVNAPNEFHKALPGLKITDVKIACHSLVVFASLWRIIEGLHQENAQVIERNLNRVVKHLSIIGVPADEVSLNRLCERMRAEVLALRLAKEQVSAA